MGLTAEEFVNRLLSKDAEEQPSDQKRPDDIVMELPDWFDKEKFDRGRRFYDNFCYSFTTSMMLGLVAVFSIPSILRVLVGSKRSTSMFTAYRRYLSTILHTVSWFENELKPGSTSWRSLNAVRVRHVRAGFASKAKGLGTVSQRDIALTQFGFIGFSILKPDMLGIRQLNESDWEDYNFFWRVLCYMIGLEDKYNICRETVDETRDVCQLLLDRVYTPCLENVPEYFEHMARVMLDGMWSVNPTIDVEAVLYFCRYLANVPGYIYTEKDRIEIQRKLKKYLNGKSLDTGVDATEFISKPAIEGLPEDRPPRILYYKDFHNIESVPAYKRLNYTSKSKLYIANVYSALYCSYIGRLYFNWNFKFSLFLMRYFPYLAFFRFGVKASMVNMFEEDPIDDSKPKLNAEYFSKDTAPTRWYDWLSALLW